MTGATSDLVVRVVAGRVGCRSSTIEFVRRPTRHWREFSSSLYNLSSKSAANLKRSGDLAL